MAWTSPRTWVSGEVVTAALLNTHLRDNLLAFNSTTGPSGSAFTPAMAQSVAITLSSAIGRYVRYGSWVIGTMHCVASSSGTASNSVLIGTLPVNALSTSNGGSPGWGFFRRSLNPNYTVAADWQASQTFQFFAGNGGSNYFGISPAITITSGDIMDVSFCYEGA